MSNTTILDACKIYGREVLLPAHNNPKLFSKWLDNLSDLETQLLTDANGERIEGKNKYTDDTGQIWGPVRWPWKAATEEATFQDYPRKFLFDDHLLAIGSTGWNWRRKESWWLGYDFDALVGHAAGVGVADSALDAVASKAPDFVDVIRSTRGAGKHLYIFFDKPFPSTRTHTEHAALARAFLPVMSAAAGFDFSTKMDVCGSILWIWHKGMTPNGFTPVKKALRQLTADDVPPNWRDHLDVITGGRSRVRVRGWTPEGQTDGDDLDEDTQAYAVVKPDECHQAFMKDLEATGYSYYWVPDHHLAQTHTHAIKKVFEAWAEAGHPMKGPYDTNSPDTDPGKVNAYMRPKVGGGWDVYRFGEVAEHPLWDNLSGKTHCTLNVAPSLRQGVLAAGGFECSDAKNGFQVDSEDQLYEALSFLGSEFRLPNIDSRGRAFTLKTRPGDNRIILSLSRNKSDRDVDFIGWEKKSKLWIKLLDDKVSNEQDEDKLAAFWDNKVRVVKSTSLSDSGVVSGSFENWLIKDKSGLWVVHPKEHVTAVVGLYGITQAASVKVCGTAIDNAWAKVCKPFEPEYPGGREWNYDAPQYRYKPAVMQDGELPEHPTWDLVFNHCGSGLDRYIEELDWCATWGIRNGGDYLRAWLAAMIRHPYCRLPYLFFYSPEQNTGKTTFHETISLLLTKGVNPADKALTSQGDFNGELSNVLLGTIDETDVAKAGRSVYNKVKDWTTAMTMSIHGKYKEVYQQLNVLHLIQTANDRHACPVFGGDSRITIIQVPPIKEAIGKEDLVEALKEQAPHFMTTLMSVALPKHTDRMRVPVIETDSKQKVIDDNRNPLEEFIEDHCTYAPGYATSLKDFVSAFLSSLEKFERPEWSKPIIRRGIPEIYPVGYWNKNVSYVGNLLVGRDEEPEAPKTKFIFSGGRLVREQL